MVVDRSSEDWSAWTWRKLENMGDVLAVRFVDLFFNPLFIAFVVGFGILFHYGFLSSRGGVVSAANLMTGRGDLVATSLAEL